VKGGFSACVWVGEMRKGNPHCAQGRINLESSRDTRRRDTMNPGGEPPSKTERKRHNEVLSQTDVDASAVGT